MTGVRGKILRKDLFNGLAAKKTAFAGAIWVSLDAASMVSHSVTLAPMQWCEVVKESRMTAKISAEVRDVTRCSLGYFCWNTKPVLEIPLSYQQTMLQYSYGHIFLLISIHIFFQDHFNSSIFWHMAASVIYQFYVSQVAFCPISRLSRACYVPKYLFYC
jgi:hypothetical protein